MSIQPSPQAIPDHIRDDLLWDHGYEEFALDGEDPYLAISRLHEGPGMVWSPNVQFGKPGWLVTRYAFVQEIFTDWEHFASDYQVLQPLGIKWKLNPIEFDPPQHQYYRKILNPFFSPAKVRDLDGSVTQACESLIAAFDERGSCEFVSEFAEKFPAHIFLDLMGMPKEKLPEFLFWSHNLQHEISPFKRAQAMMSGIKYMRQFIQEQRQNPLSDLLKGLTTTSYNDERPLTDDEILGMCLLAFVAGLDTVYSVLGWTFRYLAGDVALQDHLRANPDDLPKAVEEFLRAFGVSSIPRRVRKDLVFHGIPMKVGDLVKLSTPAAGRDPQAFDNPHTIDINRKTRHVAFGTGSHMCLGMHLARREIRTVLEAFLSRFKNIRLQDGEACKYHAGNVFGVDWLPLTWDRV